MKIAIIYESITGNTKSIAQALYEELKERIVYFGKPIDNIQADLYVIGSWTDKGMCCKEIELFLKKLNCKKVIYFGTAGFGNNEKYYQLLENRIKTCLNESNIWLGSFFCLGKMPIAIREKYEKMIEVNPNDKRMMESIRNFDIALSHPNDLDVEQAKKWVREILKKI